MDKTQRCLYDVAKKTSTDFVNLQGDRELALKKKAFPAYMQLKKKKEMQTPFLCKMIVHAGCKTESILTGVFLYLWSGSLQHVHSQAQRSHFH